MRIMSKKTLSEYYQSLLDQPFELRKKIAKECDVSIATVYRWLRGLGIPDKLKREKVAEIIGKPIEELFPHAEKGE